MTRDELLEAIKAVDADLAAYTAAKTAERQTLITRLADWQDHQPVELIEQQEAADIMGVKVHWIRNNSRTLPFCRKVTGRKVMVDKAALMKYLNDGCRRAA